MTAAGALASGLARTATDAAARRADWRFLLADAGRVDVRVFRRWPLWEEELAQLAAVGAAQNRPGCSARAGGV